MYPDLLLKLKTILDLKRSIIGIRFFETAEAFDRAPGELIDRRSRYCVTLGQALDGKTVKLRAIHNVCPGSNESLGFTEVPASGVLDGERFELFKLYENREVAKKAQDSITLLAQRPYGYVAGPLETLEEADTTILFCNPYQAMRINQGYAYKFGEAKHWGTIGNEALCSDLTARPLQQQDMNISFLCCGARTGSHADDSELGIGIPIAQFPLVAEGVIQTVNEASNNRRKRDILQRAAENHCDLGFEILMNHMYGSYDPD